MTTALVGNLAPTFDLETTAPPGMAPAPSRATLDTYRGRWLVLVFYPHDFSLVCPTELKAMGDRIDEFRARGAEILGVSTDSVASHERWIAAPMAEGGLGGLAFPLASDPDGSVSRAYGVYLEYQHVATRGLFIIDPNGVLQYQVVHNLSVGRSSEEVLRVLGAIQTGGLCAGTWSSRPEASHVIDPTKVLDRGRVISHYRIEGVIGSGTFSTVYRARDLRLDRDVALKVFKTTDPDRTKMVLKEARAAASLNHPNIGMIFAVDDAEGASMIAMEYLRGRTLADYLRDGPQDLEWVGKVARQVAYGMAEAHRNGIVHGDLKPANIVLTEAGLVKLLDFGLARRVSSAAPPIDLDATVDSLDIDPVGLSGTPSYMSPEQVDGEPPTTASDIFAFGVIVLELLTGRKAFPGPGLLQVINQIRKVDPETLAAQVPPPFDDMIRCSLAADPADRGVCFGEIGGMFPEVDCPLVGVEG